MTKPTTTQTDRLRTFRFVRAFGLVFAAASVPVIASNIPGLLRDGVPAWAGGNAEGLPILLLLMAGFPAIGVFLFILSDRGLKQYRAYVDAQTAPNTCRMCNRPLGVEADPLSGDCGGDCWGCIGSIEADMGWEPAVEFIALEIEAGLRNADGTAKPYQSPTLS
jgi:hypothetical protein